jgi:acetyltransferase
MILEPLSLLDSPTVRVFRAQAGDALRIAAFYLGLSPESRYQRFFSHRPRYTPEELHRLSHPDPLHELCLLAVAGEGDDAIVVGDLRCVRNEATGLASQNESENAEAEIALVVADAWRHQGIGRLLLCSLMAQARLDGYTSLQAYVASTNAGMLKLIREFNFHFEPLNHHGTMRVLRRTLAQSWNDAAWQLANAPCRGVTANAADAKTASIA